MNHSECVRERVNGENEGETDVVVLAYPSHRKVTFLLPVPSKVMAFLEILKKYNIFMVLQVSRTVCGYYVASKLGLICLRLVIVHIIYMSCCFCLRRFNFLKEHRR